MTLRRISSYEHIDDDPFDGTCSGCGEPIFRPGGTAWTHNEGWRDDDHAAEVKA